MTFSSAERPNAEKDRHEPINRQSSDVVKRRRTIKMEQVTVRGENAPDVHGPDVISFCQENTPCADLGPWVGYSYHTPVDTCTSELEKERADA